MPDQPPETYVAWASQLLLVGCGLATVGGLLILARARRARYHSLRRRALVRGWRLLFFGVGLLVVAGLLEPVSRPLLKWMAPPTPTLTALPPPTSTPTFTPAPSSTPSPSPSPGPTLSPAPTRLPTLSPTPALPRLFITPPGTVTVTPLPEAVAANLRFSLRDDCMVAVSRDRFDSKPMKIFAHFYYDNWLRGVQWSGVWYHNDRLLFVETLLWEDSTGGCGFTNYDNQGRPWPAGDYEIQIFIGDRWLLSGRFAVSALATPTP
jgi:hypothetical protein